MTRDFGVRLVVDGGQTMLRMGVLQESDQPVPPLREQVSVPGFQWTAGEDPVEQQCQRVVAAWEALGRPGPVDVVALGLAGGASDRPSRERLAPLVAERLGARKVLLTGDDVTTHLGVLAGEPGVVVAAGTGVACLAVTSSGQLINIDGLGYLFGDSGGGFSLGLAGLRAALAGYEGRGAATALTARAERRVGRPLRDAVKTWYRSPSLVADVAAFAAEVAEVAQADPVARVLCLSAGEELAVSVTAAVRKGFPAAPDGSVPVSWAGGVLGAPVIFEAFSTGMAELCPAATLRTPQGDSLGGAVRLAASAEVPHLASVVVHLTATARPEGR
ncbi:BadF/BadG/BcrA/BcrD ATPase family protein [Actinopolymorpha alba]|uniref:BadF/BadG/BcrA/BcrD ATPase family protein n=1 Tax=Actinopolymorpha alba TaxID=533267 RepID=UPI000375D7F3|nr:BadF/BadG/BcrA/BcrD ATPase family protein [Actinopolymorpha alba]